MNEPVRCVDLNADLGEGFPNDEALLQRVTSASVCCGAHAGDRETIAHTLGLARQYRVIVGAHPGFPDREQFGRREWPPSAFDITSLIIEQVEALRKIAREVGVSLAFVKPHGALYNQAQVDGQVAGPIIDALAGLQLPVLGQPGSRLEQAAAEAGVTFIAEGFPERRYTPDGRLVARTEPDAVLHDLGEIGAQAVHLAQRAVSTLCIHGDDPRAVDKADAVRAALRGAGFTVRAFAK